MRAADPLAHDFTRIWPRSRITMTSQSICFRTVLGILTCVCTAAVGCTAAKEDASRETAAAANVQLSPGQVLAPAAEPAREPGSASTTDLEQRIATAFPGWRLSTETEIFSRTRDLNKDYPPESLWGDRRRQGEVWWVWRGDFDGDGQQDFVTIASNRADPSQDKVLAFHADGSHAEVADLGGQGVEVIRKGEDWGGIGLPTDAILLEYWEKAKEAVRWYPGTRTYGGAEVADDWETT